jgi:hypothetical protein
VNTNRFYGKKIWVRRMTSYLGGDGEASVGWTISCGARRCWPAAVITSHRALISSPSLQQDTTHKILVVIYRYTDVLLYNIFKGVFSIIKGDTRL